MILRRTNYHNVNSIVKIYDGDTIKAWTELRPGDLTFDVLRLLDVDTPEINRKEEYERAILARDYVIMRLGEAFVLNHDVEVWYEKKDSFGRWLSMVILGGYGSLNQELLDGGYADKYTGLPQRRGPLDRYSF